MLIDSWHPVTSDLGLIHASVERTVAELIAWHELLDIRYSRRDVGSSFKGALESLPPLSAEMRRRVFVPTACGWTTCFQSGIQGSDPGPAMSVLAQRLGVLSMRVCSTPLGAAWPATVWEVYAPEHLGGTAPLYRRRTVFASNDGGRWVFGQSGEPYPFEDRESYARSRKRDRFTREQLAAYLEHFGLRPFSDDFYVVAPDRPAVLLERLSRSARPPREFALEEVIAGLPWRRGSTAEPLAAS